MRIPLPLLLWVLFLSFLNVSLIKASIITLRRGSYLTTYQELIQTAVPVQPQEQTNAPQKEQPQPQQQLQVDNNEKSNNQDDAATPQGAIEEQNGSQNDSLVVEGNNASPINQNVNSSDSTSKNDTPIDNSSPIDNPSSSQPVANTYESQPNTHSPQGNNQNPQQTDNSPQTNQYSPQPSNQTPLQQDYQYQAGATVPIDDPNNGQYQDQRVPVIPNDPSNPFYQAP